MASPQIYTLSYITINGRLLAEHVTASLQRMSNANTVLTLGKGFAGVSPGAKMCTISVENAVPSANFEYDPGDDISNNAIVEIGVIGPGGKSAVSRGYIGKDSFSQGVNSEAKMSFEFQGSYPDWS
jgi:hypothetical protein